jgi:Williams-Beuren syndrome DDT (WSD), D-TOX E motif
MAAREQKMQELSQAKRAADFKFRKVRLAFEGPKRPNRSKPASASGATSGGVGNNGDNKGPDVENENGKNGTTSDAVQPFKPTATKKQFEAALRAQQKASDAYENGIRTLVARTEPVGFDRNFNAVYCFRHDPDVLYVEELRDPLVGNLVEHLPLEFQPRRRSWHVIAKTSLFDLFLGSLDLRGKRENALYEELMGPFGQQRSLRRHLHDDLKVKAEAAAKVREMESLKKRLQSARIKCDEERGRRSGRLADAAEDELAHVQQEIDQLQRTLKEEKTATPTETLDYEDLTGLQLLRKFDFGAGGRAVETRRSRQKQEVKVTANGSAAATTVPQMPCSKLVPTGNIDGTGAVGLLVSKLLEIEEMCESLAPWERTDIARSTWISKLESTVHAWYTISPFHVGPSDSATAERSNSIGYSPGSANGSVASSKRRRTESPGTAAATSSGSSAPSIASVVNSIRQPLLDLEARVADLSNVSVATRDADLADENMSTDGSADGDDDEAEKARLEGAWKKIIHRLRKTPTKRHVQIRQLVVSAITSARQAHLPEVVASLRAALLLYHPQAAFDCKAAAIKLLVSHGDYNGGADGDDDDADDVGDDNVNNEDRTATTANNTSNNSNDQEDDLPSVLCTEAAMLRSSLDGSDDASRLDWIETVKSCKTISRLASLTAAFCLDATEKMQQIQVERDDFVKVLEVWKRQDARKSSKTTTAATAGPSEVWANVRFTNEICMAKAEDWPWWPARICEAKDAGLAASLAELNRTLIALVGEGGGLRVVRTRDQILPFTGNPITAAEIVKDDEDDDDDSDAKAAAAVPGMTKEIREQLQDCLAMARRILRGQEKAATTATAAAGAKKR